MDGKAILLFILGTLITSTKAEQEKAMRDVATQLAAAVANSATTIDDTVVKQLLIPNLQLLLTEIQTRIP